MTTGPSGGVIAADREMRFSLLPSRFTRAPSTPGPASRAGENRGRYIATPDPANGSTAALSMDQTVSRLSPCMRGRFTREPDDTGSRDPLSPNRRTSPRAGGFSATRAGLVGSIADSLREGRQSADSSSFAENSMPRLSTNRPDFFATKAGIVGLL